MTLTELKEMERVPDKCLNCQRLYDDCDGEGSFNKKICPEGLIDKVEYEELLEVDKCGDILLYPSQRNIEKGV
jgi:hypothetical protein